MSDKKNDSKIYNAADIQRYLTGEMPESEMHALERASLDDPFLADAIEGYGESTPGETAGITGDLDELHSRLKLRLERNRRDKIVPFFRTSWWKVAASIMAIAGPIALIYYLAKPGPEHREVAINEVKAPEQSPVLTDTGSTPTINKIDSAYLAIAGNKQRISKIKASRGRDISKQEEAPAIVLQLPPPGMAPEPPKKQRDSVAALDIASNKETSLAERKIMQSKPATTAFYETDRKKEDALLKRSIVLQDAVPVMGLPAFNRYLENNKKIPTDSLEIHGEVILSFMVSEIGALSDFKIEKSLSKQADNEALRLIKEGPAWKVLKNQKAVATVTIKF